MQTNKTHKCKENRPKLQKVQSCPSVKKSSNMQDMGKSLALCKAISKTNFVPSNIQKFSSHAGF